MKVFTKAYSNPLQFFVRSTVSSFCLGGCYRSFVSRNDSSRVGAE